MDPAKPLRKAWNWVSFLTGIGLGLLVGMRMKTVPAHSPDKQESPVPASQGPGIALPQHGDWTFDVETMRRALDGRAATIAKLEQQVTGMRDEYQRLTERYKHAQSESQAEARVAVFRALEPVLVQLPVMTADLKAGADLSAKDVLDLALTMPRRLQSLEIKMFGEVGSQVSFDLRLHKPSPSSRPLAAGDVARVVGPGFRYRDEILTRAEVTRESS